MKRNLLLLLFMTFALFSLAHDEVIRGGFVEYRHLNNKVYEVKFTLYVNCPYVDFTPYIGCMINGDTLEGDSFSFVSSTDITGIPARCAIQSNCSGGSSGGGVNKMVWTRLFDLDTFSFCNVFFYGIGQKRDQAIVTGHAGTPFLIFSELNQCKASGSSSPVLAATENPYRSIVNTDVIVNFGIKGLGDFDSVSYSLVAGLTTPWNQLNYGGPYSPTKPVCFFGSPNANLAFPAGFHLDPVSGEVLYRPTSQCTGPIVVEIKLWKRNGNTLEPVSTIIREHTSVILAANGNNIPRILGPHSTQACTGKQTCFNILTDDADTASGDSTFLTVESEIPGLSVQISHAQGRHATAQVCWTPDSSHIRNHPYTFTAKVKDNFCPLPGQSTHSFSFFVRETPKATVSVVPGSCGRVTLAASPLKTYPSNVQYRWNLYDASGNKVDSSGSLNDTFFLDTGTFYSEFTVISSVPCWETHYDTFVIAPYNVSDIVADTLFCRHDTVRALVQHTAQENFTYAWWRGNDPTILGTDSAFSYPADSSHRMVLRVRWDPYCEVIDTQFVQVWQPKREIPGQVTHFCPGDSAYISILAPSPDYTYLWNTRETSDSIAVKQAGWYSLQTTYFQGCVQLDSIELNTHTLPVISLFAPDGVCPGDSTLVHAGVTGSGPFEFVWDNNATDSFRYSGGGLVEVSVSDGHGCSQSDAVSIGIYTIPVIELIAPDSICPGDSALVFARVTGAGPFEFVWGNNAVDSFRYSGSGQTSVTVTDDNGCRNNAAASIALFSLPVPDDSVFIVCAGEAFRLFAHDSTGIRAYYSFGDSGNYLVPGQNEQGQVLIISRNACPAIYPIDITVNQPHDPAFTFVETDPGEVEFTPVQQGNATYHWDFGDNTSSTSMLPVHTFMSNGPFSVRLTVTDSTTGCADSSEQVLSFNVGLAGKLQNTRIVAPNPFENGFGLHSSHSGVCRIYTTSGRLIWQGNVEKGIPVNVDAASWYPGLYILRLQAEGTVFTEKLIRK